MKDERFYLWIEHYLRGTLTPEGRGALTERVARDPEAWTVFENHVRLSLELGARLKEEDLQDLRRRASLLRSVESGARDRRAMDSVRQRLGVRPSERRGYRL